ncbi:response regulator [Brevibacillus panacihumi]|uniref:Transcriptional regulatory protein n=1 Tax=Brevibacillus panacihumi TaxID=497735 RepID=A0A3M8DCD3_9BACL|nr:response regulator [Brevibacillus panacihumi]RNB85648.1 response regulator [Brevibacillus panacihumi]
MNLESIRVVVIEDDPMVQEINRSFIERVSPFQVVGVANNGVEGVEMVRELQPDLVVIDVFMPVQDGIKTLTQLRAGTETVDVIVITAANDKQTIQTMLRYGAMDFIIKPFQFERIRQALENYREFRSQLRREGMVSQSEVDQLLFRKWTEQSKDQTIALDSLPKGLHAVTLGQIVRQLGATAEALSAEEVAERVGIARVTARRYLDYLVKAEHVKLAVMYGGVGRPTNRYVLAPRKG